MTSIHGRDLIIQAIEDIKNPKPSIELPDWKRFNEMVGGFRPREFTLLCGGTGSGKTSLLANISHQLLLKNVKQFVMSVETGHVDFGRRILSIYCDRDLNTGNRFNEGDIAKGCVDLVPDLATDNLWVSLYDNRVPVEKLIEDLSYHHEVKGCKIAMIDNLNFFLDVTSSENAVVEMDRVMHELIIFCKQTDMHIVMVCHPKKSVSSIDTRVYSEYDIKGSSTAVQEAHNVFIFNRPMRKDIESGDMKKSFRELTIAKMRRRGQFVNQTIIFDGSTPKYREVGKIEDGAYRP